jgi:hypothetical protein
MATTQKYGPNGRLLKLVAEVPVEKPAAPIPTPEKEPVVPSVAPAPEAPAAPESPIPTTGTAQ